MDPHHGYDEELFSELGTIGGWFSEGFPISEKLGQQIEAYRKLVLWRAW